jgi:hypothetical protein
MARGGGMGAGAAGLAAGLAPGRRDGGIDREARRAGLTMAWGGGIDQETRVAWVIDRGYPG